MTTFSTQPTNDMQFIDLFAGCGGLSLGLMKSGWSGLFAIERDSNAFKTLKHNLIDGDRHSFVWPSWLEKSQMEVGGFTQKHRPQLRDLNRKVHLIAGGPPCQGFSFAGRRKHDDPRNILVEQYLDIVRLLQPDSLLIENVHGIAVGFHEKETEANEMRGLRQQSTAERIKDLLETEGYRVFANIYYAKDFGVPQLRPRFIIVGIRTDVLKAFPTFGEKDWATRLNEERLKFLKERELPTEVTAYQALSDLACSDTEQCSDSPNFQQICYDRCGTTIYQKILRDTFSGTPNSLRLAKHRPDTIRKFRQIQDSGKKGKVSAELLKNLGTKKRCVCWLDESKPAPTLTTLPDDLLHYQHPRILTVRECARLQSFPDWFAFQGKYTTGGTLRTQEIPRYSQVGNAVPPFMAEVFGLCIARILKDAWSLLDTKLAELCSDAA